MNRTITYHITEEDANLSISQFLKKKKYSSQNLTQIKRMPQNILLNGVFEYMQARLSAGDELVVNITEPESSDHIPPVPLPLDILYEDEDIIVLNKPAGMPIHPSLNNYENSLANALAYYYKEQGKPFIFRCCNRLDRDTSGVTIVAKHLVSGSILSHATKQHRIHREYLAIVEGHPEEKAGTIDAPLARAGTSIIERKVDFENGERAVTHYRVLQETESHSLVSLVLETGRTHQIRVHMKHIGHPLIGDYLYNPQNQDMERQALHAYRMEFEHPISGEHVSFMAPLPKDMRQFFPVPDR